MTQISSDSDWDGYARVVGLALQDARRRADLSQEKVAHAAGIATFTYRKLEQGVSNPGTPANPRLHTLAALAQVLGVTMHDLIPAEPPDVTKGRPTAD